MGQAYRLFLEADFTFYPRGTSLFYWLGEGPKRLFRGRVLTTRASGGARLRTMVGDGIRHVEAIDGQGGLVGCEHRQCQTQLAGGDSWLGLPTGGG